MENPLPSSNFGSFDSEQNSQNRKYLKKNNENNNNVLEKKQCENGSVIVIDEDTEVSTATNKWGKKGSTNSNESLEKRKEEGTIGKGNVKIKNSNLGIHVSDGNNNSVSSWNSKQSSSKEVSAKKTVDKIVKMVNENNLENIIDIHGICLKDLCTIITKSNLLTKSLIINPSLMHQVEKVLQRVKRIHRKKQNDDPLCLRNGMNLSMEDLSEMNGNEDHFIVPSSNGELRSFASSSGHSNENYNDYLNAHSTENLQLSNSFSDEGMFDLGDEDMKCLVREHSSQVEGNEETTNSRMPTVGRGKNKIQTLEQLKMLDNHFDYLSNSNVMQKNMLEEKEFYQNDYLLEGNDSIMNASSQLVHSGSMLKNGVCESNQQNNAQNTNARLIEQPQPKDNLRIYKSINEYDIVELKITCNFGPHSICRFIGIHSGMTLYNIHRCICICLGIKKEDTDNYLHVFVLKNGNIYGSGKKCSVSVIRKIQINTDRHITFKHIIKTPLVIKENAKQFSYNTTLSTNNVSNSNHVNSIVNNIKNNEENKSSIVQLHQRNQVNSLSNIQVMHDFKTRQTFHMNNHLGNQSSSNGSTNMLHIKNEDVLNSSFKNEDTLSRNMNRNFNNSQGKGSVWNQMNEEKIQNVENKMDINLKRGNTHTERERTPKELGGISNNSSMNRQHRDEILNNMEELSNEENIKENVQINPFFSNSNEMNQLDHENMSSPSNELSKLPWNPYQPNYFYNSSYDMQPYPSYGRIPNHDENMVPLEERNYMMNSRYNSVDPSRISSSVEEMNPIDLSNNTYPSMGMNVPMGSVQAAMHNNVFPHMSSTPIPDSSLPMDMSNYSNANMIHQHNESFYPMNQEGIHNGFNGNCNVDNPMLLSNALYKSHNSMYFKQFPYMNYPVCFEKNEESQLPGDRRCEPSEEENQSELHKGWRNPKVKKEIQKNQKEEEAEDEYNNEEESEMIMYNRSMMDIPCMQNPQMAYVNYSKYINYVDEPIHGLSVNNNNNNNNNNNGWVHNNFETNYVSKEDIKNTNDNEIKWKKERDTQGNMLTKEERENEQTIKEPAQEVFEKTRLDDEMNMNKIETIPPPNIGNLKNVDSSNEIPVEKINQEETQQHHENNKRKKDSIIDNSKNNQIRNSHSSYITHKQNNSLVKENNDDMNELSNKSLNEETEVSKQGTVMRTEKNELVSNENDVQGENEKPDVSQEVSVYINALSKSENQKEVNNSFLRNMCDNTIQDKYGINEENELICIKDDQSNEEKEPLDQKSKITNSTPKFNQRMENIPLNGTEVGGELNDPYNSCNIMSYHFSNTNGMISASYGNRIGEEDTNKNNMSNTIFMNDKSIISKNSVPPNWACTTNPLQFQAVDLTNQRNLNIIHNSTMYQNSLHSGNQSIASLNRNHVEPENIHNISMHNNINMHNINVHDINIQDPNAKMGNLMDYNNHKNSNHLEYEHLQGKNAMKVNKHSNENNMKQNMEDMENFMMNKTKNPPYFNDCMMKNHMSVNRVYTQTQLNKYSNPMIPWNNKNDYTTEYPFHQNINMINGNMNHMRSVSATINNEMIPHFSNYSSMNANCMNNPFMNPMQMDYRKNQLQENSSMNNTSQLLLSQECGKTNLFNKVLSNHNKTNELDLTHEENPTEVNENSTTITPNKTYRLRKTIINTENTNQENGDNKKKQPRRRYRKLTDSEKEADRILRKEKKKQRELEKAKLKAAEEEEEDSDFYNFDDQNKKEFVENSSSFTMEYYFGKVQFTISIIDMIHNKTNSHDLLWVPRCCNGSYGTFIMDKYLDGEAIQSFKPEKEIDIDSINLKLMETRFSKNVASSRTTKRKRMIDIDQTVLHYYREHISEFFNNKNKINKLTKKLCKYKKKRRYGTTSTKRERKNNNSNILNNEMNLSNPNQPQCLGLSNEPNNMLDANKINYNTNVKIEI